MGTEDGVRRVIINADDFGYSFGVNSGIREAIDHGVVTSTSVMVKRIAASEASEMAKRKDISLGLHLDMTEEGLERWLGMIALSFWPIDGVQKEFDTQVQKFKHLTGRLPDHIDSHHNIHRVLPNWRNVTQRFSREHGIPVRSVDAKFVMSFFWQVIY